MAIEEAHEEAEAARAELEERGEIPRGLPPALEDWASLAGAIERPAERWSAPLALGDGGDWRRA